MIFGVIFFLKETGSRATVVMIRAKKKVLKSWSGWEFLTSTLPGLTQLVDGIFIEYKPPYLLNTKQSQIDKNVLISLACKNIKIAYLITNSLREVQFRKNTGNYTLLALFLRCWTPEVFFCYIVLWVECVLEQFISISPQKETQCDTDD